MFENWNDINTLEITLTAVGIMISSWAIAYTIIDRNKLKRRDYLAKIIKDFNDKKEELFLIGKIARIKLDITDTEERIARSAIALFCAKELVTSTYEGEPTQTGYSVLYKGIEDFEFNGKWFVTIQNDGKTKIIIGNSYDEGKYVATIPFVLANDPIRQEVFWIELFSAPNKIGVSIRLYSNDKKLQSELNEWTPIKEWLQNQNEKINKNLSNQLSKDLIFKKYSFFNQC